MSLVLCRRQTSPRLVQQLDPCILLQSQNLLLPILLHPTPCWCRILEGIPISHFQNRSLCSVLSFLTLPQKPYSSTQPCKTDSWLPQQHTPFHRCPVFSVVAGEACTNKVPQLTGIQQPHLFSPRLEARIPSLGTHSFDLFSGLSLLSSQHLHSICVQIFSPYKDASHMRLVSNITTCKSLLSAMNTCQGAES